MMMPAYSTSPVNATARWKRPDSAGWRAAKTAGDAGEALAAGVFRALGLVVEQHRGYAPHDLSIAGKIEVKTDRQAGMTGNVAVELSYRGAASGIMASTATGWCIIISDTLYLMPTAGLRALIERGSYRRVAAGDDGASIVALVPVGDIRRIARSIIIRGGGR
jgi:hypothetical protein